MISGLLSQLYWSLALIFVICEISERVSSGFREIDFIIGQFTWYLLPINIWEMLPMITTYVQDPVIFVIFGAVGCNRYAFQKVSFTRKKMIFHTFKLIFQSFTLHYIR